MATTSQSSTFPEFDVFLAYTSEEEANPKEVEAFAAALERAGYRPFLAHRDAPAAVYAASSCTGGSCSL